MACRLAGAVSSGGQRRSLLPSLSHHGICGSGSGRALPENAGLIFPLPPRCLARTLGADGVMILGLLGVAGRWMGMDG
jgi:hypothetical protein